MGRCDETPIQPRGVRRIVLWIGSLGPLGHMPASGTVTVAVVGIPLYYGMHDWSRTTFAIVLIAATLGSVWIHDVGDRWLGEKDSRQLVWDEVIGYLFAVGLLDTFSWRLALAAFLIERTIDIVKVPPARSIERRWPGGWGVVGDDVVAGLYTCAILQALTTFAPSVLGTP